MKRIVKIHFIDTDDRDFDDEVFYKLEKGDENFFNEIEELEKRWKQMGEKEQEDYGNKMLFIRDIIDESYTTYRIDPLKITY